MKKYTLLGHVFELEDNAYHFLARYIERLEQYSATHAVSHEVIDDIKYSIIEKLYGFETPITEKQVIDLANSLGEPEVMFDESVEGTDEEKRYKRTLWIDKEKPMIRGVCYWISKSLNVPVRIVRIIMLLLILAQGTGLVLYVILALFVPYKDKKKTTGAIGSIVFEIIRIAFWLLVLGALVPLTFGSLVGTGIMFFTPVIENQSISAWIPQYMYAVGILVCVSFLLLVIGSIGTLFKQKWLNKGLGLTAAIIIFVGTLVTAGTAYKTVMQAMSHKTTVDQTQNMIFDRSSVSGDRVTIDMTNITDYSDSWPYFGVGSADVRIIRTTGTNLVSVQVKTTLWGQSDAHIQDAISKLQPLNISGDANNIVISRTGKLFTSEIPFAGVHKQIIIAVPSDREVFINKDRRTNMYVQNDGLGRGYCAADVYVYNPNLNEFTCKNGSGEVFYNTNTVEGKIREEIQDEINDMAEDRMERRGVYYDEYDNQEGLDAVPPMYPNEQTQDQSVNNQ